MISTFKLYILLVLFPQILWLIGRLSVPVTCENCSSDILFDNHFRVGTETKPSSTCEHTHTRDDGLLAKLCTCRITSDENGTEKLTEQDLGDKQGGWHTPHCFPDLAGPCNIQRRNSSLTLQQFLKDFASEPVILTGMSDQQLFRQYSTKYRLLKAYGHELITVATANTHSYHKVRMTLCEYVQQSMKPQDYHSLGNETLYHFGDNDRQRWDGLFSLYSLPPFSLPGRDPVLSFGLAGPGTGVPFHVHGPTFAETIYGRKRWFLYPPAHSPKFDPDQTTLLWFTHTYPNFSAADKPLECTLKPGEILFVPDHWWHSTLNVDAVVFVSVFYS